MVIKYNPTYLRHPTHTLHLQYQAQWCGLDQHVPPSGMHLTVPQWLAVHKPWQLSTFPANLLLLPLPERLFVWRKPSSHRIEFGQRCQEHAGTVVASTSKPSSHWTIEFSASPCPRGWFLLSSMWRELWLLPTQHEALIKKSIQWMIKHLNKFTLVC